MSVQWTSLPAVSSHKQWLSCTWAGAEHSCAAAPHKAPLFQAGGYARTELSLLDHSCKARMNGTHFILESSLNKCGTRTAYSLNKIVYFNSVSISQRGFTICTAHRSSTRKPLVSCSHSKKEGSWSFPAQLKPSCSHCPCFSGGMKAAHSVCSCGQIVSQRKMEKLELNTFYNMAALWEKLH